MTPIYAARDLTKTYDGGAVQALRGIDFEIEPREFVAVTGPSGCGKTTLLHLLGALDQPSGGSLDYRGQSMAHLSDAPAYRAREIGFVFQAFHLLPTFTVLENVQIPMFETDRKRADRSRRALELLEAVGMTHRAGHLPAKLSGGERQRAAIARSLANEPTVLLADEPTGNLDSENSRTVMELLSKLHRERRMTLVLITHDPAVASHASRIIRMKDGRLDAAPELAQP
jgi:ABC-type lipoprotein export system ATPase subunit